MGVVSLKTGWLNEVGAELKSMMRHGDSTDPHPSGTVPPSFEGQVMHTTIDIGGTPVRVGDDS